MVSECVGLSNFSGVCWLISSCFVDVVGYLEEYLGFAVVKLHVVVFY